MTHNEQTRFENNVRILSATLLKLCEDNGIRRNDGANVISGALAEALAAFLGPLEAVERLRMVADLMERQILDSGLNSVQ